MLLMTRLALLALILLSAPFGRGSEKPWFIEAVQDAPGALSAMGPFNFSMHYSLSEWESRCSMERDPKGAWLALYARWHVANRHSQDARFLVHICTREMDCFGLGEELPFMAVCICICSQHVCAWCTNQPQVCRRMQLCGKHAATAPNLPCAQKPSWMRQHVPKGNGGKAGGDRGGKDGVRGASWNPRGTHAKEQQPVHGGRMQLPGPMIMQEPPLRNLLQGNSPTSCQPPMGLPLPHALRLHCTNHLH